MPNVNAELERLTDEGNTLMEQRDHEAAAEKFRAALALDPTHAVSWYNLGVTQDASEDNEAAIESYREAVKCDPEFVNAWSNLGWALLTAGKPEDAVRWESAGEGDFTLEPATKPTRGTDVILHVRDDAK